jgi:hypothetical protein
VADLTSSLTSGTLPRLGQSRAKEGGFRNWLSQGLYHVLGYSSDSHLELQITDLQQFVEHISFDFERFSLSSRESFYIAFAEKESHNLAGWPLLKLYYSAFFAAHAIMRSQGGGIVKVEREHASHVNSILTIANPGAAVIRPGMYSYKVIRSRSGVPPVLQLEPAGIYGGVHESFWKNFCAYLEEESAQAVFRGDASASDYSLGVYELSNALIEGARGVWLSSVRNEINYQHGYGAWFPLRKGAEAFKAIDNESFSASNSFRMDISKEKSPLTAFTNISRYLACLNIEVSDYIASRSTAGYAFGQKWRRLVEQV